MKMDGYFNDQSYSNEFYDKMFVSGSFPFLNPITAFPKFPKTFPPNLSFYKFLFSLFSLYPQIKLNKKSKKKSKFLINYFKFSFKVL